MNESASSNSDEEARLSPVASSIRDRLNRIRENITRACERAGRSPSEVLLVGASKQIPIEGIRAAITAGLDAVGENYIQEALPKIDAVGHPVSWHFIGRLQRNKARLAATRFDLIQTVDSPALARSLNRHAEEAGRRLPILVEINLTGDPNRPGTLPNDLPLLVETIAPLSHLDMRGLMGMPPPVTNPDDARPYFRTLQRLREDLHNENGRILSMGMTADYSVAVEEGSTLVRIGTGIFGPRSAAR